MPSVRTLATVLLAVVGLAAVFSLLAVTELETTSKRDPVVSSSRNKDVPEGRGFAEERKQEDSSLWFQPLSSILSSRGQRITNTSDVVVLVFTGDNIVRTRGMASYSTWAASLRERGVSVVFFSESSFAVPFPVLGMGGEQGKPGFGNDFRMWKALDYVSTEFPDAKLFFKADDDSYTHPQRLLDLAYSVPVDEPWMVGNCGGVVHAGRPVCVGAGYLFPRPALDWVRHARDTGACQDTGHDDVTTSHCFLAMGGRLTHYQGFYPESPIATLVRRPSFDADMIRLCASRQWIVVHHVEPDHMVRLHTFCAPTHALKAGLT